MIFKSKDVQADIKAQGVDIGGIGVKFYTEDKNSAIIRIQILHDGNVVNLNDNGLIPYLDIFLEDESIFTNEELKIIKSEIGLVQYNISPKVIKHIGRVNCKLFLKNEKQTIHVSNFYFDVVDSGVETAIAKEIKVDMVKDTVKEIISEDLTEVIDDDFKQKLDSDLKQYLIDNNELFRGVQGQDGKDGNDGKSLTFSDLTDEEKLEITGPTGLSGKDGVALEATPIGRNLIAGKVNKPMITFIDDDGRSELREKWLPILKEKQAKLTVALVTNWLETKQPTVLQWEEVHDWKEKYGVEFVSHMHTHPHASQLKDEEIHYEFKSARDILKRENLTYDIIVQPFGENTDSVRKISRTYARANFGIVDDINAIPYNTFRMKRVPLGEDKYTTFEQYKEKIDQAIANNGWIVFKSHSQYESFNENQINLIKQIIDYCRANDVLEVTLEEGLDLTGNLIDIGDYDAKAMGSDYYILDNQGHIHSNTEEKNYYTLKYNSVNFNSSIDVFNNESTSVVPIVGKNTVDFPNKASGLLVTFKGIVADLSYQLYFPSNSDIIYKRRWDNSNKIWTKFVNLNYAVREEYTRHYTPNTVVPANSSVDVVLTNSVLNSLSFKAGDMINGVCEKALPSGIMYNIYIGNNNNIVVRFFNITGSQISVPATFFNFRISIPN